MKKAVAILLLVALALSLFGCASAKGKLKSVQKTGKLVVYMDPNFPPFEFMGASGAEGVDVEIAKAIAQELGVQVEIQEANFDAIVMSIKGGKGDIAISGLTVTQERQKSVDFSIPYINSVQYLILPADSNLDTVESLAGLSVGVAKGYTGSLLIDFEINDEEGVLYGTGTTFTEYPSAMEATMDMNNQKVAAVIMDEYVAKSIAAQDPGLKAVALSYADGTLAEEEYGVAVAKGNEDLLEIINGVIARILADNQIEEWVLQFSA